MRMIAKRRFPYAHRRLQVGEAFEATTRDAKVLKVTGRAEEAPVVDVPALRAPPAAKPALETAPKPRAPRKPKTESAGTPTRRYRRRDLMAED